MSSDFEVMMSLSEAQFTDDINEAISNDDIVRTTLLLDEWASLFPTTLNTDFLTLASEIGSASIVSLLLARGLNSKLYTDALIAACEPEYKLNVLQAFVESGWDIDYPLEYMGDLPTLCLDSASMVKWAIEHGADPNLNYNNGSDSVLDAVISKSLEIVELLIDMGGAQINNTNALKFAARFGRTDVIELLLEKGAEIDEIPHSNRLRYGESGRETALHQAAVAGELEVVQLLLANGADPRLKDIVGRIALELAKEENRLWMFVLASSEPIDISTCFKIKAERE